MKKVQFEKINVLLIEQKENKTEVIINNFKHVLEDNKLYEEVESQYSFLEQQAIIDKYVLIENPADPGGKKVIAPEDTEAYLADVEELRKKYTTLVEVQVFVGNDNVIDRVNNLINL